MSKLKLISAYLLLGVVSLWAVTYSQPFAAGHGFAAAQLGACDSSYTDNAADSTNGNPVNSVNSACVGRNDTPTTTWSKELTWEAMGVAAGNNVTLVDGALDHQRTTQTHAQVATVGLLDVRVSGGASSCLAEVLEGTLSYPNTTGAVAWATLDVKGAIAVNAGACQTSSTTVRVQFIINPRTGNNASATTQVNVDNLVLTITEVTPSGRSRVIISRLALEGQP